MIAVYIALAATALLLLGRPLARAGDALTILGARYSSLLLTGLPFVIIASLWTAALSGIGRERSARFTVEPAVAAEAGVWSTMLRGALSSLPFDPDDWLVPGNGDGGSTQRTLQRQTLVAANVPVTGAPVTIAASGALSPVTIAAVAVAFGLNSGMLLFYLVFVLLLPAAAAVVARRATGVRPAHAAATAQTIQGRTTQTDQAIPVQSPHPTERIASELYHRMRYAILGLLVAAALHVLMPAQAVLFLHAAPIPAVIAAALLGFIIPLSPEAAPFAAALLLSTAGHGAALAFLLVAALGGLRLTRAAIRSRAALLFVLVLLSLVALVSVPLTSSATGALW